MTAHFLQLLTGSLLFLWHPACLTVLSDLLCCLVILFLRCYFPAVCNGKAQKTGIFYDFIFVLFSLGGKITGSSHTMFSIL